MTFVDSDIKPNPKIRWDLIHVGCTGDARWRDLPPDVYRANRTSRDPIEDDVS